MTQERRLVPRYRIESTIAVGKGIGRTLEPSDMPAVRAIMREAESKDHRWSAIIIGVATSVPFQIRRAES